MFTVAQHINWLGSAMRSQEACEPTGIMGAGESKAHAKLFSDRSYRLNNKFSEHPEGGGGGI